MAALAGMLKEHGFSSVVPTTNCTSPPLRCSDAWSLAPKRLRRGQSGSGPDLVVVGNVVTRNNPEAAALLQSPIPYLSMPEALWHFFSATDARLMVCGTHGKTTSTSMMAQVLIDAGRDPGVLIGGLSFNLGANYRRAAVATLLSKATSTTPRFSTKDRSFSTIGLRARSSHRWSSTTPTSTATWRT